MSLYYSATDIDALERDTRTHLINSITGIKPANMIGTVNNDGVENLAIFSSVVHLGSHPPLLGFVIRPQGRAPRDTYNNIQQNCYYTINQVPVDAVAKAHQTSTRFASEVSEFEECGFTPQYLNDFSAPFVAESPVKIGLRLINKILIPDNNTELMIGQIEALHLDLDQLSDEGQLNLEALSVAGISGLNSYYSLNREKVMPSRAR